MKKNLNDLALAILRIGASAMMLTHGIPKIDKLFAEQIEFADPLGLGATVSLIFVIIGEVIAPIFIIAGYKTKIAAIPTCLTMLVAGLIYHFEDPFGTKEKALLFALVFFVIFLAGPGKYAVDKK
jgi:putative oxidoreductase